MACVARKGYPTTGTIAALISVEHVVEHKKRVAGLQCEIAYVGLDLWALGTTAIAINVYFQPGQSLTQFREGQSPDLK